MTGHGRRDVLFVVRAQNLVRAQGCELDGPQQALPQRLA